MFSPIQRLSSSPRNLVAFATVLAALAFSAKASAGSILVEQADGSRVSRAFEGDACPIRLRQVFPYQLHRPDLFSVILPKQGVVMTKEYLVSYIVKDTNGEVAKGNLMGEHWDDKPVVREAVFAKLTTQSVGYEALVQVYPDLQKPCTSLFQSRTHRIAGIDPGNVKSVTFFDEEQGAAAVIEAANEKKAMSTGSPNTSLGKAKTKVDETSSERIACLYLASKKGDESAREKLAKIRQRMPSWTEAAISAVERSERDASNPMLRGEWGRATPAVLQSPSCD